MSGTGRMKERKEAAMPQIPYEPVPRVMPEGKLAPMQIQASPADFGAQIGQTLQQAGGETMQNALARQQLQNETTVNDVINNEFFPAFQDQYQKYYALQGKDALDQLPAYQQSMRDLVTQYRGSFANQAQQKMFDEQTSRRLQFEIAGMSRYADQQNKVWQPQTNAATVDRYINSAADKYNDPQAILVEALGIRDQISNFSVQSGQGAEVGRQQTAAAWNKLYDAAIMRLAVNNAAGAKELFDDGVERGLISGTGQMAIAAKLKPYLDTADASQAYSVATSGPVATRIAQAAYGAGVEPSTALSIWSAEGAVTNPETKNPRSSATGVFQLMPGTWADMGGTEENRADANEQIAKGVELIKRNMVGFMQDMGRWPQAWESYLCYGPGCTFHGRCERGWFGPGTAVNRSIRVIRRISGGLDHQALRA